MTDPLAINYLTICNSVICDIDVMLTKKFSPRFLNELRGARATLQSDLAEVCAEVGLDPRIFEQGGNA